MFLGFIMPFRDDARTPVLAATAAVDERRRRAALKGVCPCRRARSSVTKFPLRSAFAAGSLSSRPALPSICGQPLQRAFSRFCIRNERGLLLLVQR